MKAHFWCKRQSHLPALRMNFVLQMSDVKKREWMNKSQSIIKDNTSMICCSCCSLVLDLFAQGHNILTIIFISRERFIIVDVNLLMIFLVWYHVGQSKHRSGWNYILFLSPSYIFKRIYFRALLNTKTVITKRAIVPESAYNLLLQN